MNPRHSYTITYTATARRQMNRLPLAAAIAMHEHRTVRSPTIRIALASGWNNRWPTCSARAVASTALFIRSMTTRSLSPS